MNLDWILQSEWFPGADLAYAGFAVAGIIYPISAVGMFRITKDKIALIEENGQRSETIEAKSGMNG